MAGMDVEVGIRITRCVKIAYTTAEVIRSTLLPIPVLASAITNLHPELVLRAKKYSVKFPAALMHRLCRFAYSSRTGFHLAWLLTNVELDLELGLCRRWLYHETSSVLLLQECCLFQCSWWGILRVSVDDLSPVFLVTVSTLSFKASKSFWMDGSSGDEDERRLKGSKADMYPSWLSLDPKWNMTNMTIAEMENNAMNGDDPESNTFLLVPCILVSLQLTTLSIKGGRQATYKNVTVFEVNFNACLTCTCQLRHPVLLQRT